MNKAEEILQAHTNNCTCDEAYTKRKLTAPDCFWCEYSDGIVEAMKVYALACLKKASENGRVKDTIHQKVYPILEVQDANGVDMTLVVDKLSIYNTDNLI